MAKVLPLRKIGYLQAVEIPGQAGRPVYVVFHGYGADATDLVSLSNQLAAPAGSTWLFPNGIIEVQLDRGTTGRAWFQLDPKGNTPSGMKKAREQVYEMLKVLKIPLSNVIFIGFSQGAMLATQLALYGNENPKGLVILSGGLLDSKNWSEKTKSRAGLSFYQSHGEVDEEIPIEDARQLEQVLINGGLKGKLFAFKGGHEIPQQVISGVNNYLRIINK